MTEVVIVGAGPAGAKLAGLLAHRGIKVTLLERRREFAREFRGGFLMPSGGLHCGRWGSLISSTRSHTTPRPVFPFS